MSSLVIATMTKRTLRNGRRIRFEKDPFRRGNPSRSMDVGRANEGKLLASCLESNSNSGGGGGGGGDVGGSGDDGDTCEMLVVVMSMMALGRTCLIAIKLTSIFVRPQASLDLAREITVLYENPSNWKRTKVNGKSDRVEKRPWKRYLSIAETTKGDEVWFKEGLPLKGMGGRKIEQEEEHKPAHDSNFPLEMHLVRVVTVAAPLRMNAFRVHSEIPALLHSVHLPFYVNVLGRELRPEDDVKPTLRRKRKAATERREDDVIWFPFTLLFYGNTGY
ncbi:hypothetical protein V1477_003971 [Vespula maculifrons]|uniref:Uncharacterized protein n=1 Tax=Vespula maculifrons TaxID=7453 RepID=A0ABD2CSG5_VESMC